MAGIGKLIRWEGLNTSTSRLHMRFKTSRPLQTNNKDCGLLMSLENMMTQSVVIYNSNICSWICEIEMINDIWDVQGLCYFLSRYSQGNTCESHFIDIQPYYFPVSLGYVPCQPLTMSDDCPDTQYKSGQNSSQFTSSELLFQSYHNPSEKATPFTNLEYYRGIPNKHFALIR